MPWCRYSLSDCPCLPRFIFTKTVIFRTLLQRHDFGRNNRSVIFVVHIA